MRASPEDTPAPRACLAGTCLRPAGPPLSSRRYSITISIGVLFLVIKALSYSGILDFDD